MQIKTPVMIFFGLIISIFIIEVIFRIIEHTPAWRVLPVIQSHFTMPDPITGFTLRPNHNGIWIQENRTKIQINKYGMRDRERSIDKADNVSRIILTGDSVTESLQVNLDSTFSYQAEESLNRSKLKKHEILNVAIGGATPLMQLLRVKHIGNQFNPDMVIFITDIRDFSTNVMLDDSLFPAYRKNQNGEYIVGKQYLKTTGQRYLNSKLATLYYFMQDHSRVLSLLYTRYRQGMFDSMSVRTNKGNISYKCDEILGKNLEKNSSLWIDQKPDILNDIKQKYFNDAKEWLENSHVIFALRGIGFPQENCPDYSMVRNKLKSMIKNELNNFNFSLYDIDENVFRRVGSIEMKNKMHGFGRNIGNGHLNKYGHTIYSDMLLDMVRNY